MKKIDITEAQSINIMEEVKKIVNEYSLISNVECIYHSAFVGVKGLSSNNILYLTVVIDGDIEDSLDGRTRHFNDLARDITQIEKFGLEIHISFVSSEKYTLMDLNSSEISRTNDLFNSTILYDKTGYYTKIQKSTKGLGPNITGGLYYYSNLASLNIINPNKTKTITNK